MNYQEKSTWIEISTNFAILVGYTVWLVSQLIASNFGPIEYRSVLISVFVLNLIFTIISQIVLASINHREANMVDVRDVDITRRSNSAAFHVMSVTLLGALILGLFEVGFFEIVHVLFYGGLLASIVVNGIKLWFYRAGL